MATITADSCSYADVSTAIAAADDGDTVNVPAGSATWNSQLIIIKGIRLIGAGSSSTYITSGYTDSDYLVYYDPTSPALDESFRLSGFNFNFANKCAGLSLQVAQGYILHNIRIDNNTFQNAAGNLMRRVGPVYGVADHNTFIHTQSGLQATDQYLDSQWCWNNTAAEFGTANNFYYEDNTFTGPAFCVAASGQGNRYCVRYNTITNTTDNVFWMFDMHGSYSTDMLGAMVVEVYGNTINSSYSVGSLDQRGSMALFFNNTFSCSSVEIQIRNEYGQNVDLLTPVYAANGEPKRVHKSYYWNNYNGVTLIYPNTPVNSEGAGGTAYYEALERYVPYPDKDFWTHNPSFNGTANLSQTYDNEEVGTLNIAGMGVGLLANRPTTPNVADVGYWATDTETLYRWHSSAWETFYTPYTYPHPLRGEEAASVGPDTAKVVLTISASETARLYCEKSKKRVVAGTNAVYTVHVEAYSGFVADVTLDTTGLPANATDAYGTNPIAYNGSTTVTIGTTDVAPGTYSLYITGTAVGGDVSSTRVILEVAASADFDINVPVRRVRAKSGDEAVFTIQADSLSGYTGDIDLSLSGLPTGATGTFGTGTIAYNGSTDLTIDTGTGPTGTYELTITGEEAA